jgi:hypothetical protein
MTSADALRATLARVAFPGVIELIGVDGMSEKILKG